MSADEYLQPDKSLGTDPTYLLQQMKEALRKPMPLTADFLESIVSPRYLGKPSLTKPLHFKLRSQVKPGEIIEIDGGEYVAVRGRKRGSKDQYQRHSENVDRLVKGLRHRLVRLPALRKGKERMFSLIAMEIRSLEASGVRVTAVAVSERLERKGIEADRSYVRKVVRVRRLNKPK